MDFRPQQSVSAGEGAPKVRDPLWDTKMFDEAYAKIQKTREIVTKVRPSLTITISPEGKSELLSVMVCAYLSLTPFS